MFESFLFFFFDDDFLGASTVVPDSEVEFTWVDFVIVTDREVEVALTSPP